MCLWAFRPGELFVSPQMETARLLWAPAPVLITLRVNNLILVSNNLLPPSLAAAGQEQCVILSLCSSGLNVPVLCCWEAAGATQVSPCPSRLKAAQTQCVLGPNTKSILLLCACISSVVGRPSWTQALAVVCRGLRGEVSSLPGPAARACAHEAQQGHTTTFLLQGHTTES